MGAKEELDDRIKAKIKPNGEGQISGQMMQNTLLDVNATNQKMYHPRGGDKLLDLVAKGITAIKGGFENLVAKQADIECITTPEIVSPEYIDGALGQGFRYYIDENGNSVMVLDKLRVMKEATFNVLTISELRSVGGQVLFTYADAKLTAAVEKQSVWRCYYDSADGGQYFLAGDQVRCQRFKGTSGDTLKYYWRLVTAVGNEELGGKMLQWIELSKEVAEGEGVPEVGDECVGLGHRGEDRRRKNAKLISAFGETGVEEISYANIDGFSLVGKETAYQSPERWRIASQRFELVAGDGIVYPIVVERGAWSEAQAPYYYYDRVSHGGNIYLCIDKRLDGTVVEPATDQHAVWLCEVRKGDDGANGKDGIAGPQGVPGTPGKDGLPTYTWIRYADTAAGAGMSNDPTGKNYIGFAYNKTTATESNTPGDYMWSLIKGEDGAKGDTGVKGEDGSDGQTTYTWIKYADNADGTGLYDLPTTTTKYIGIATNKTTATESSLKTDYIWSQFKGDTGAAAPRLKTQFSINGTTAWHDAYAVGDAYRRESNDDGATWSVAMRMVGEKGDSGADGKKTPYTDFSYAYGLSQPTVWLDAPPAKVEGQHLWERIQKYTVKADNSGWTLSSTSYAIVNEFVQIGGVNLLSGSASAEGWIGYTTMENREFQVTRAYTSETYLYSPFITLDEATQYTLSFESKCDDSINGCEVFLLGYNEGDKISFSSGYEKSQGWIKQVMTFMPLQTNVIYPMRLRFDHNGSEAGVSASIWVRNIKLEKGNKATDWSPSPEDVQAEIDKANAVLADMASDSKLTPSEKQQTAVEWSRIKAEQAKNTAAATAAGVSTAEVTIAYNTLNGYLETGANPLLKDLTTTSDIVGSTFRSAFATWYDKNATLVNATAEAVARNAADAVQIGGRNYALNTSHDRRMIYWKIPECVFLLSPKIIDKEIDVIITFWEKDCESDIIMGLGWGSVSEWGGVHIWHKNSTPGKKQIKARKPAGVEAIWCFKNSLSTTYDFSVQTGDKEMDWSPAPEDVQAEIDKATSVVYSINPSAEQIKKIVTTDAKGIRRVELLPSLVSVTATIKRGNRDESVISSAPMEIYANNSSSITIQRGEINLNSEELYDEVREWWEWFDVILYNDTTYSKELARKRIHINENADISGAEIAARINASGSEVQIEGERISVIGKMISLNKMTVDVDGNATMNDVKMNNANVTGKVTAKSGAVGPLNVEPGKLNCGVLEISEITENSRKYDDVSPVYKLGPFPVLGGATVSGKWQSTEAIHIGRPNDVTLHFGLAALLPQLGAFTVRVRFKAVTILDEVKVIYPEFRGDGYWDFPRRFTLYGFPAGCYLVMEVTSVDTSLLPVTFKLSAMNSDNIEPRLSSPYIYYSDGSAVIIDRSGTRIGYGSTIQYVGDGRISLIQRQNSGVFEFSINDVKLVLNKTKLIKLMNLLN